MYKSLPFDSPNHVEALFFMPGYNGPAFSDSSGTFEVKELNEAGAPFELTARVVFEYDQYLKGAQSRISITCEKLLAEQTAQVISSKS